jgi:hypothetical protein
MSQENTLLQDQNTSRFITLLSKCVPSTFELQHSFSYVTFFVLTFHVADYWASFISSNYHKIFQQFDHWNSGVRNTGHDTEKLIADMTQLSLGETITTDNLLISM